MTEEEFKKCLYDYADIKFACQIIVAEKYGDSRRFESVVDVGFDADIITMSEEDGSLRSESIPLNEILDMVRQRVRRQK